MADSEWRLIVRREFTQISVLSSFLSVAPDVKCGTCSEKDV